MAINKLIVMLPVMFAARKLDGEDPNVIFLLRCSYFTVQAINIALVIYIYFRASRMAAEKKCADKTIYVSPPSTPFADPKANKKYTEISFGAHMLTTARSLLTSTVFGFLITTGLHFYKGMIVGLAMQSIMGPLGMYENPLVRAFFSSGGLEGIIDKRIFEEKHRNELSADDEVVDSQGNAVLTDGASSNNNTTTKAIGEQPKKSLEEVLLDTWDEGAEADVAPLMKALNSNNINFKTKVSGWTPIMIMAAIGVKDTSTFLSKMKELGADPAIVDAEGWNALHWSAFHGCAAGASCLLASSEDGGFDGLKKGLHLVKDKEGKDPLHHARAEGNTDVAKIIEIAMGIKHEVDDDVVSKVEGLAQDEGLRKRK